MLNPSVNEVKDLPVPSTTLSSVILILGNLEINSFELIKKKHKTYLNKSNVVGKHINYPKLKTSTIVNDNTSNFNGYLKILKKLARAK